MEHNSRRATMMSSALLVRNTDARGSAVEDAAHIWLAFGSWSRVGSKHARRWVSATGLTEQPCLREVQLVCLRMLHTRCECNQK